MKIIIKSKGSAKSGNYNHTGIPGHKGGSAPSTALKGFSMKVAGIPATITDAEAEIFDTIIGNPQYGESLLPKAERKARECQENARKEYLLQKAAGRNPVYVVGQLTSLSQEEAIRYKQHFGKVDPAEVSEHYSKIHKNVLHAWVEVDGKVVESTPFLFRGEISKPVDAQSIHWAARYVPKYMITNDAVLSSPLGHPMEAVNRLRDAEQ